MNKIFFWLLSFSSLVASSQQTAIYTEELADFNHAVLLYNEGQYLAAQILFDKIKYSHNDNKEFEADCVYYITNCAIRLEQLGVEEKINLFVNNYATSSKQNQIYVEIAKYYFEKGQYEKSLIYAQSVNENAMSFKDLERFYFQKAYCNFSTDNIKEAQKYFNKVKDSKEYGEQAIYYLGYIAYDSGDFDNAKGFFDKIKDKEKYGEKMGYFQADMNFKSGNFEKAIEKALGQINTASEEEKSELSKIIGESYFNLGNYDKAIPYLLEYKGKNGKWSNVDFYQLGYSYYQHKDYNKAIDQFNKIIGGNDDVAQNAYYHLGESYLNTGKKPQALNAFKNASEMNFNLGIQEDAYLNYTKLSYEIGNPYLSTPQVITSFLAKYPKSPYKVELESLLIDSYITSKNYKEAFVLLEKNESVQSKLVFQKVSFYRGLELYSEGNYSEALSLFTRSISKNQDLEFTSRAQYWKGECEFYTNQFARAIVSYQAFLSNAVASKTPEYKNVEYSQAYACFKLKQYDQAVNHFKKYISSNTAEASKKKDSYMRLGDCSFVLGKYSQAIDAYNKVIDNNTSDVEYANFQKALAYGFLGKNSQKIETLNAFVKKYPKSNLADDALFEIGNTYIKMKNTSKGVEVMDQLMNSYPESSFLSRAILRQGLVYYNTNQADKALAKFKRVASEYPNTPESAEAVTNARLIYLDNGNIEEYADWVNKLGFVEVSNKDLEKDSYESAEKHYLQKDFKKAIKGFNSYLSNFGNGEYVLKANFYLGEIYYADKKSDLAIPHFEYVTSVTNNSFTELALVRLSEIYLTKKDYDSAIVVLKKLENDFEHQQNEIFAQSNLMKIYYEQNNDEQALIYAEKVLRNPKIDNRVDSDARVIIARTAFNSKDWEKAKKSYSKVAEKAKGELAAEALYYDAYFKNNEGKYEESNAKIQILAKNYSQYKYYGAKGLILMAKNFYALKDSYQATYILENVIKNFKDFSDIISEAENELKIIKTEESKRNSSVSQ